MSQRSIAAYATRRPYDSTPFLSHARSYMEHITANDEAAKDRLVKGLDSFLDRTLFDLPQIRIPARKPPLPAPDALYGGQLRLQGSGRREWASSAILRIF